MIENLTVGAERNGREIATRDPRGFVPKECIEHLVAGARAQGQRHSLPGGEVGKGFAEDERAGRDTRLHSCQIVAGATQIRLEDLPVAVLYGTPVWDSEYYWVESYSQELLYVHADHIGTPRRLTRTDNTLVWRWDSDPFGNGYPDGTVAGPSNPYYTYDLRFPGQLYDIFTSRHYNYFGDYDPSTGRYRQSDPIGLAGGVNTYAYANGQPTFATDPRGLFAITPVTSWTYDSHVPARRADAGGTTRTGLSVTCTCTPQCNKWKLKECSAEYRIRVTIHSDATGDVLARLKYAEGQHVADYLGAVAKMREAGEKAEKGLADRLFSSRFECESRIAKYVAGVLLDIDAATEDETIRKYDYFKGPHTIR